MESKLQRRVQRYGWDLAADDYEPLWQAQLAPAHAALLEQAALTPGERVIDVACGTGLVTFKAADAVGPDGQVLGVDLSGRMVDGARRRAETRPLANTTFARMDAEALELADASFDVALCSMGLMYMPEPEEALREMRRVLRPGGRMVVAVWGERSRCGWASVFEIVDEEVASEVCPLFFRLGQRDTLAHQCEATTFEAVEHQRLTATLNYTDAEAACDAAFVGGPLALAWSRLEEEARTRVRARYVDSIASWRGPEGYQLPGEFVVVAAAAPASPDAEPRTQNLDLRS